MKASARFAWLVLPEPQRSTFLEALRAQVSPEQFERVRAMTEAFPELLALLDQSGMSLARLRRVAFGAPTEKTATVCPPVDPAPQTQAPPRRKRKGHGRHGARSYTGAPRVPVSHPTLKTGALCPGCGQGKLRRPIRAETKPGRTGIFTTGIVARAQDHPIALFFTGRRHAGENLGQVLRQRQADLPPPLQMCDGLWRNEPQEFKTILGCCLAHGRRGFVEVAPNFPEECRHVLESLRTVYRFDAQAKADGLSPRGPASFSPDLQPAGDGRSPHLAS